MQRAIAFPRREFGRLHWNQDYADIALAVVLTAVALFSAMSRQVQIDFLSVPLVIAQTLPLAWRRRDPIRILWITGVAITLYSVLGYHDSIGGAGVFVAFYTVAANEPRHRAMFAAAVTAGGIFISFAAYAALGSISDLVANLSVTYLSFGLAWVIGDNLRVRRAYTRELEDRAVQLEREHEEQAALAVAQERGRIARELHDVVAHHVSVMIVQAAAARRVADKDPAAAQEALASIENAGRMALAEMRRMLEV
jgi:signal transduction histidine kinase